MTYQQRRPLVSTKEIMLNPCYSITSQFDLYLGLTPKALRSISCQKPLETTMFVLFAQENKKKTFFSKSNHKILYLNYSRLCG